MRRAVEIMADIIKEIQAKCKTEAVNLMNYNDRMTKYARLATGLPVTIKMTAIKDNEIKDGVHCRFTWSGASDDVRLKIMNELSDLVDLPHTSQ